MAPVEGGRSEAKTTICRIAIKVDYRAVVRMHSLTSKVACTCSRLHHVT